jgi:Nif-specific regulatory protein
VICLPLVGVRGSIGVLYLDSRGLATLRMTEDLPLLEAFASQATIAVENARLHAQLATQRDTLEQENKTLRQEVKRVFAFENIVGESTPMRRLFQLMERVKDVNTPVLIQGETGTGKELIARALHYEGHRKGGPFIVVNCGAIAETLMWSTLFGHKKGSFTGAVEDKFGLFELANGGTLFLDEVGELSLELQVALLRAVDDRTITRLGEDDRPRTIDIRFIYATNRDLKEMVDEGTFREDFYYRLNVFRLDTPPLRERGEDLRLIVERVLKSLFKEMGKSPSRIAPETYQLFYSYRWPGNVRQLKNELERAAVLIDPGEVIGPRLFAHLVGARPSARIFEGTTLREKLEASERTVLEEELGNSKWNISKCARRLECTRQHLHNRIRKLGIVRPHAR